jgi:Cdc6-like AAA superfamily ATPase
MVSQRLDFLEWVASPDVSSDLLSHSEKRLQGTSMCMLENPIFRGWRDRNESSMLWVSGAPGTGKTVLAAHVVQHLANFAVGEKCITTFYFFDKSIQLERSLEVLAAAIISQILYQSRDIHTAVVTAYETSKRFGRSRMSHLDDSFPLLKG